MGSCHTPACKRAVPRGISSRTENNNNTSLSDIYPKVDAALRSWNHWHLISRSSSSRRRPLHQYHLQRKSIMLGSGKKHGLVPTTNFPHTTPMMNPSHQRIKSIRPSLKKSNASLEGLDHAHSTMPRSKFVEIL